MGVTRLKLVVVGDGAVGKTCLLMRFCQHTFTEEYVPTVFDNMKMELKEPQSGTDVALTSWDTAGQEDYDRLRPLSYPDSDVILICFSLQSRDTLANVQTKWCPEVNQYAAGVPKVLVGMKSDLNHIVSSAEGAGMAKKTGCLAYCECSAKTGDNVELVFMTGIRCGLRLVTKFIGNAAGGDAPQGGGCCALL